MGELQAQQFHLGSNHAEVLDRLQQLVGRTLNKIEVTPLGVMFHFSSKNGDNGAVYWATGKPPWED